MNALGAVGYLNMLPFFHLGDVPVFRTPRALNDAARAGKVGAACTSAIAGLRAGWIPLQPALGVGAAGSVRSVFLEPVPFLASEHAAWDALTRSLQGVFAPHVRALVEGTAIPSPLVRTYAPTPRPVVLFSSGASEHSEWLARTLLEAAGFSVRVDYVPLLTQLSEKELREVVELRRQGAAAALLVIGDPALARCLRAPATPRLDLADLWRTATGLPCVFACWFQCGAAAFDAGRARMVLEGNLRAWRALPARGKRDAIVAFLGPEATAHLDFYESYLEGITFEFGAAGSPFARTVALYEALLAAAPSGATAGVPAKARPARLSHP